MSEASVENIHKTVGKILQDYRKAQDLTINDIAEQLRLDVRIIEALEQDNFDALPSATYVRGYLRSYAKILSADADNIISLYNDRAPGPPEIIPDVKHSTQISSSDRPVKAFTYLVTFILVLLLIAWAQSRYIVRDEAKEPVVSFVQEDNDNKPVNANEPIEEVASTVNSYNQFNDDSISETVTETTDFVMNEGDANGPDNNLVLSDQLTGFQEQAEQLTTDDSMLSLSSVITSTEATEIETTGILDQEVSGDDGSEEIMTGPDSIMLRLTADSWIEIYDVNEEKVYLDLARSGEKIFLRGTAPFKVKLGFSQGVSLEFNGESFDPAPFSIAGVARFTLGE